ncbi:MULTISPECIES: ParB/RepB/Spo0J family partition protein [unclassified Streptomyces]|uniref:ParB/RepB/Spo0J family partition protein n=1 Tax=unclassified Streptomyces TaxID=2593676 RepID=UPI001BE84A25|nr:MULTISPECIES: ParB/RepB/Spo0J family partition protein [unclassified Streptomyces]MBT2404566.1 ParB/RepB/Spo0J family partition protein [Streptomyces sp. ISL-21]MBT2612133.1 ParB/RepB/Spo0J family partition protein [Streptomyces sp. ISL-87]
MSKADKLGGGSSFQRASAVQGATDLSARGRAKAVAEGRIPSYTIVKIPLAQVSSTPLNPRRNFGTPEELTRFGEELRQAQLAACVVVTRAAYLELWPDHAEAIGDAEYVLVNGERRFRSARHVELAALDFVVRDEFADSREEFLNKLLKENLQREDFDPVERATGIQQLVDVCAEKYTHGAQSRAAEQLGKSRAWVTNQLGLLALPPEVRASVSAGETSSRDAIWMARRLKDSPTPPSAEDLFRLLTAHKAEEALAKAQQKAILAAAGPELLTAVNNPTNHEQTSSPRDESTAGPESAEVLTAVNNPLAVSVEAEPDVEAESLLTVVNNSAAAPDDAEREAEPGGLLTAVNNPSAQHKVPAPQSGNRRAPVPAGAEVLTAVNNSAAAPAEAEPEAEPGTLLTAVNNPGGGPATPLPHPIDESAQILRQYLGATPGEQADNIVRALSPEELVALTEELYSRI